MKDFDAIMNDAGRVFSAIHIELDPEEGVHRIFGRAAQEGRADDANEEIIRRRMKTFTEKTIPVIDAYRTQGKVTDIDGMKDVSEGYEKIKKAIL